MTAAVGVSVDAGTWEAVDSDAGAPAGPVGGAQAAAITPIAVIPNAMFRNMRELAPPLLCQTPQQHLQAL